MRARQVDVQITFSTLLLFFRYLLGRIIHAFKLRNGICLELLKKCEEFSHFGIDCIEQDFRLVTARMQVLEVLTTSTSTNY